MIQVRPGYYSYNLRCNFQSDHPAAARLVRVVSCWQYIVPRRILVLRLSRAVTNSRHGRFHSGTASAAHSQAPEDPTWQTVGRDYSYRDYPGAWVRVAVFCVAAGGRGAGSLNNLNSGTRVPGYGTRGYPGRAEYPGT
eukprot:1966646-Rhodomonas_salina.1